MAPGRPEVKVPGRGAVAAGTTLALVVLAAVLTDGCVMLRTRDSNSGVGAALAPGCDVPCPRVIDGGEVDAFEPAVAVNPRDPAHAAVGDAPFVARATAVEPDKWGYAYVTRDGGHSWRTIRLPGGPGSAPDHPLAAMNRMADSAVTFLPDGTVLYATLASSSQVVPALSFSLDAWSLVVLRSLDGGLTYPSEAIRIVDPAEVGAAGGGTHVRRSADKPWMAVNEEGQILLSWLRRTDDGPLQGRVADTRRELMVSLSKDGGATWGPVRAVDSGGGWGASPSSLADGRWAVAYQYSGERSGRIGLALSNPSGTEWTVKEVPFKGETPTLKVQARPGGERLVLSFTHRPAGDDQRENPTLTWTDDHGSTWAPPVTLDVAEAEGFTRPALAIGPDGTIWATFFHWRGSGEAGRAEYRAVTVRDGTVSDAVVLQADFSETSRIWKGEYEGLAAYDEGAYAVWAARDSPDREARLHIASLVPE